MALRICCGLWCGTVLVGVTSISPHSAALDLSTCCTESRRVLRLTLVNGCQFLLQAVTLTDQPFDANCYHRGRVSEITVECNALGDKFHRIRSDLLCCLARIIVPCRACLSMRPMCTCSSSRANISRRRYPRLVRDAHDACMCPVRTCVATGVVPTHPVTRRTLRNCTVSISRSGPHTALPESQRRISFLPDPLPANERAPAAWVCIESDQRRIYFNSFEPQTCTYDADHLNDKMTLPSPQVPKSPGTAQIHLVLIEEQCAGFAIGT